MKKEILNNDRSKVNMDFDISQDVLNARIDTHISFVTEKINNSFCDVIYPSSQKLQKVPPIPKKKNSLDKKNYRLASVLAHLTYPC